MHTSTGRLGFSQGTTGSQRGSREEPNHKREAQKGTTDRGRKGEVIELEREAQKGNK